MRASVTYRPADPFCITSFVHVLEGSTSAITLGWQPSPKYRSACFMSSPINSTVDVVPSLRHKFRLDLFAFHSQYKTMQEHSCA